MGHLLYGSGCGPLRRVYPWMGSMCGLPTVCGEVFTGLVDGLSRKHAGVSMKESVKTRWGEARQAGTEPPIIFPGDLIHIKHGEDPGYVTEVLDVVGNVYRSDNRIVVRNLAGELVFYLPWDVEIVERRTTTPWVK